MACRFVVTKAVAFLLGRGAKGNIADELGQTPLHEALGQTCRGLEQRMIETLELRIGHDQI